MGKKFYKSTKFKKDTKELLDKIIQIVEEYEIKRYRLTVRQVYYQIVSQNIVKNEDRFYKKTSKILVQGRMAGLIDWDTIEDRARKAIMPRQFNNITEFITKVIDSYRKYRWKNQSHYVEVWVEKEALVGILENLAAQYHVLLFPGKGYSSISTKHMAAERIIEQTKMGKECHILYLGDHDPSGIDMERDIREKLAVFGCTVSVERVALTMEQITKYNPPPNPAKQNDSRYRQYVKEHGTKSWELDALKPDVLINLVEESIKKYLDEELYNEMVAEEEAEQDKLIKFSHIL